MIPLTIYLIIHHGNDSLFQNRHKRDSQNSQVLIPTILIYILLGHAPGQGLSHWIQLLEVLPY
jgi:hypothetical protein